MKYSFKSALVQLNLKLTILLKKAQLNKKKNTLPLLLPHLPLKTCVLCIINIAYQHDMYGAYFAGTI